MISNIPIQKAMALNKKSTEKDLTAIPKLSVLLTFPALNPEEGKDVHAVALCDTGCLYNLISKKLVDTLNIKEFSASQLTLQAANGTPLPNLGSVELFFQLGQLSFTETFLICDTTTILILGLEFFQKHKAYLDCSGGKVIFRMEDKI